MNLPHDLKDFTADQWNDGFQIIPPHVAARLLLAALFAGAIFERFM